jgi:hypothetical protein
VGTSSRCDEEGTSTLEVMELSPAPRVLKKSTAIKKFFNIDYLLVEELIKFSGSI